MCIVTKKSNEENKNKKEKVYKTNLRPRMCLVTV